MFKNYLIVAIRNLLRHRLYTVINVLGLGIGIGACVIALAFVRYEWSWNRYHPDHDRIFQLLWVTPAKDLVETNMPGLLGPTLKSDYSDVIDAVRLTSNQVWVSQMDGTHMEEKMCVTDPSFCDVFSFELSQGVKEQVFQAPHSVVVTESAAKRWFGEGEPVGRSITIGSRYNAGEYVITGVLKDPPANTSSVLRFDLLTTTRMGAESAKTKTVQKEVAMKWDQWQATAHGRSVQTFVKLRSAESADHLSDQFQNFMTRYLGTDVAEKHRYELLPLGDLHLYGKTYGLHRVEGDVELLYQVGGVALLIVFVGCINFVNLSTARASRRQKEIGVRKVTGARKRQIIAQFTLETLVLATGAAVMGMTFAELIFPTILAHGGITLPTDVQPVLDVLPYIPFFIILLALLAGVYPAFVLASFHPIQALKPASNIEASHVTFHKGLVLLQFTVCVLLIVGTLVMYDQVDFMQNRHLGFDRDLIVSMPIFERDRATKPDWGDHLSYDYENVKAELLAHPNILKASAYRWHPGTFSGVVRAVEADGQKIGMRMVSADETYLELFGIPLLAGRNFQQSALFWRAKRELILNQTAVTALGWGRLGVAGAVGKPFHLRDAKALDGSVVGVVPDFQVGSLHASIEPIVIHYAADMFSHVGVKIKPDHIPETLAHLKTVWERFLPERPFEYTFLDDNIHQLYLREEHAARLAGDFSVVAILLGCMGLFGLASFTVERRKKEIAIRKTLGATLGHIALILSRESALLVIGANVIAWPIGFYVMSSWLERFADRIDLHVGFFALAGVIALLVALGTVGYQAVRAAYANPVDALRNE